MNKSAEISPQLAGYVFRQLLQWATSDACGTFSLHFCTAEMNGAFWLLSIEIAWACRNEDPVTVINTGLVEAGDSFWGQSLRKFNVDEWMSLRDHNEIPGWLEASLEVGLGWSRV